MSAAFFTSCSQLIDKGTEAFILLLEELYIVRSMFVACELDLQLLRSVFKLYLLFSALDQFFSKTADFSLEFLLAS